VGEAEAMEEGETLGGREGGEGVRRGGGKEGGGGKIRPLHDFSSIISCPIRPPSLPPLPLSLPPYLP